MQQAWTLVTKPEIISTFVLGVLATWAASQLPKMLKRLVFLVPRSIGRGFSDFFKHGPVFTKAKSDPPSAVAYFAFQLSQLILYSAITLIVVIVIAFCQIVDPSLGNLAHRIVLLVSAVALLLSAFRAAKRMLMIKLLYYAISRPLKPGAQIAVGKPEQPIIEYTQPDISQATAAVPQPSEEIGNSVAAAADSNRPGP